MSFSVKKHFILDCGIFQFETLVIINKTPRQVQKLLEKYKRSLPDNLIEYLNEKPEGSGAYVWNKDPWISVIYLRPTSYVQLQTLFEHEKFHFVYHILSHVGIKLSDETEEVYAYLSEHLTRQFILEIW